MSAGTAWLWWALRLLGDANPVRAVITFIIVAEPVPAVALQNVRQRLINTAVGGAVGLASLLVLGVAGRRCWWRPATPGSTGRS